MLKVATFLLRWPCNIWSTLLYLLCIPSLVSAAFINFDNCLDPNIVNSDPLELQFIPLYFNARFIHDGSDHKLNITIYGNVSGQATEGPYPAADDPSWTNPNDTFGKIVDLSPTNNKYSTLFQHYDVLTYSAYDAPESEFCKSTVNDTCPLSPSFNASSSDPYALSAFTVGHSFSSSYSFGTFAATIRVESGDAGAPDLACISASITPDLGTTLSGLLTWLPVAVLAIVAVATGVAGIYSPWGSADPFRWTTNYGRDEDLLRLVTPGFGDCLQYIQFIYLTGALTLNYPGFYQPATSQIGWAALQFNESFVSHGSGKQALVDGIYVTNGTYGMTRMSQLVGMSHVRDIWACLAIWLVVLSAAAVVLCQAAFFLRWMYRQISNTTEQDLRRKNLPLSAGMVIRILYNYFLLPIVSLSMFQLVVAPTSPASVVAMAVILLLIVIAFAAWILRVIFRTKPRSHLFDDLPTVLLYGSLYNTYSDNAAPFALIPAFLTFMRGVAIGAVQPSGIAQLVILAICEVILILTLHAFRPFSSPTHMNAIHTFFAAMRLVAILLSVAFVPSLGVTEAPKGWIGYTILLLHGIVLVFVFFLNALQTLIEVLARVAGAGGDPQHGATRGGLISYSWRQLAKRQPDRGVPRPGSMTSDAAILANDADAKSFQLNGGRSRSMSASSQALLNQHLAGDKRSSGFEQFSQGGDYAMSPTVESPSTAQFSSAVPTSNSSTHQKPVLGALKTEQPNPDFYYRPPRARRATLDPNTPGAKSRQSGMSGEWGNDSYDDWPERSRSPGEGNGEGPSVGRETPLPAHVRHTRDASDTDLAEGGRAGQTDYAVREVDFYYGVRGPALSHLPTRKRKTGPADPMGPVSNATTWFQRLIGGKTKEKGKGFEVVRSSRAPPSKVDPRSAAEVEEGQELQTSPSMTYPPYRDSPEPQAIPGAEVRGIPPAERMSRRMPLDGPWDEDRSPAGSSEVSEPPQRFKPSSPPVLPTISRTPSISMPMSSMTPTMRSESHRSPDMGGLRSGTRQPSVPRKSSRRTSSRDISNGPTPHTSPRHEYEFDSGRPTSVGLVHQRMTGDSIFQSGIGEGSSAEIVQNEHGVMQQ